MAGIGEKPAIRSGPYRLMVCTWAAALWIVLDLGPGQHRIAEPGAGLPVHLHQQPAGVRVAHAGRRVGVPGEGGAPRAAPRLVLRPVRTDTGVIGLLGLPGDDAVLDVHLPGARAGAVHPVRGPHHLVVAPAIPVEHITLAPPGLADGAPVGGHLALGEEAAAAQQQIGDGTVDSGVQLAPPRFSPAGRTCSRQAVTIAATRQVATSSRSPTV